MELFVFRRDRVLLLSVACSAGKIKLTCPTWGCKKYHASAALKMHRELEMKRDPGLSETCWEHYPGLREDIGAHKSTVARP
jgi:hypothetical protein